MTDSTANEGLWLPNDIWATIASFLDNDDLVRFRQLCQVTQFVGSDIFIMQPLYNRLYAIDNTLPPILPPEGTLTAFKQAFEKIQARQQFEISYLTEHHSAIMAKPEYLQVFQESATVSLQSLEAINVALDKINSEIITARIDITSSSLSLNNAYITRLPVTLFQEPAYAHFWQNLTELSCINNQLTELNLQGLTALQVLACYSNQLTALNVQGLIALQKLNCSSNQLASLNPQGLAALQGLYCNTNQLTELNVQGLVALCELSCHSNQLLELNLQGLAALIYLDCDNNPLMDLNLTGVPADVKNKHAGLERSLLFQQFSQADSNEKKRSVVARLGADYTPENCFYYCPVYAAKLFVFDSKNSVYSFASSALSQASTFLPSFSFGMANHCAENTSLKRKRDKEQIRLEVFLEESDNQSDLKKGKENNLSFC